MYMKKGLRAGALADGISVAYVLVVLLSVPAQKTASVVENASTVGVPGWLVAGVMFIATALCHFWRHQTYCKNYGYFIPLWRCFISLRHGALYSLTATLWVVLWY